MLKIDIKHLRITKIKSITMNSLLVRRWLNFGRFFSRYGCIINLPKMYELINVALVIVLMKFTYLTVMLQFYFRPHVEEKTLNDQDYHHHQSFHQIFCSLNIDQIVSFYAVRSTYSIHDVFQYY